VFQNSCTPVVREAPGRDTSVLGRLSRFVTDGPERATQHVHLESNGLVVILEGLSKKDQNRETCTSSNPLASQFQVPSTPSGPAHATLSKARVSGRGHWMSAFPVVCMPCHYGQDHVQLVTNATG